MLDVAPPVTRQCLCANLIPATLLLAYPVLLSPTRHLSAALIAVSPEEVGARTLCPSRTPKGKKSHRVRSGALGGQNSNGTSVDPARPIQRWGR